MTAQTTLVEQWGVFELTMNGSGAGNPFIDVTFGAEFRNKHRAIHIDGFYDGEDVYKVRFMPDVQGEWLFTTSSNLPELNSVTGKFTVIEPSEGNHGVVRVHDTYHFAYDDGTPYWQVGTTCYAWTHQGDSLEAQTLQTLASAPFNKMRMCVFPKHYNYNRNDPLLYAFEQVGSEGYAWDFTRFNPTFFRHIEQRVAELMALGIEADIILFHPYDRWGFSRMPAEVDDRYLRYIVARLAAYRNVWWSMANEWDLMSAKSNADWDRFLRIVQESDPYQHLRSIHNCNVLFDHGKPPITHMSLQVWNFNMVLEQIRDYRKWYGKPVIADECCYEGNIDERWGNITAQEMVRRFWEGTLHGGYVGHGETYWNPEELLWWAKGGVLRGQSVDRIAFYKKILEQTPQPGLSPVDGIAGGFFKCAGVPGKYYLSYTGAHQPRLLTLNLPEEKTFCIDVIDTWNMTITPLDGQHSGRIDVMLPSQPYMAVRAYLA